MAGWRKTEDRPRVLAIYSASYQEYLDEWFLATLPEDVDTILVESPVGTRAGLDFQSPTWRAALDFRIRTVRETIEEHLGEVIFVSDVDVQFFGSFLQPVAEAMGDCDLAGLREWVHGGVNVGFMALRCSPRLASFWRELEGMDLSGFELHDQGGLNLLLERGAAGVTHTLLPDCFWGSHRRLLFGEPEPERILVHHATGTRDKVGELTRWQARMAAEGEPS